MCQCADYYRAKLFNGKLNYLQILYTNNKLNWDIENCHIDKLTYFSKIIISTLLFAAACTSVVSGMANFGFVTPKPFTFTRRSKIY